ncbi:polyphosphate kinase 2 [Pararhizobium haloflavum]|uniref:polyphosphate kinase 2 n=1 Tax=Pararhizobium haloflavum TaxID=2037914 RepID=UPI000C184230|nr:polyphosphate kinase 2 [Pararhizobium haloflavum]
MTQPETMDAVELLLEGTVRRFDIDVSSLPDWVDDRHLAAGGYPYDEKLDKSRYAADLERLQIELVKVQAWLAHSGHRVIALFEGRDAAGKGGAISAVREYMNPRSARIVALPKPTEREQGQWYYQRYVDHFPTSGEFVLFDRSWYNRAGVEPVMGFCTPEQHVHFLDETPHFERMLVANGIYLFKFWLNIGRETQIKRFHDRRHTPLKAWKLSPMDIASLTRWDDYTRMRDLMFEHTDTTHAPWTVVRANDKRRARLNLIRHMLTRLPYDGRDVAAIGALDEKVIGPPSILEPKS